MNPPSLRADAADNRARIIQAAREAIASGGEVKLNAIARQAGVGQGTLYRHFPTREDLLSEVYRDDVGELVAAAPALLAEHEPNAALTRWLDRLADYAQVKRGVFAAVESAVSQDLATRSHGPIGEALTALLDAGKADGSIRPDVDARDVILLVGYLTRLDQAEWDARARHLLRVIADGLRPRAVRALNLVAGRQPGEDTSCVDPRIVRYSERPDLWDDLADLFDGVWPEYNQHGGELNHYWRQLYDVFPEWQFMLVGPGDEILAEGHTVPVAWDGTDEDLGPGIDATIAGAFELRKASGRPTAVSAMAAEVPPRHQGRGLAPVMLRAMATLTREAGLAHLIAPVRPSQKVRYPTIPIERYARWTREDGSPFDPWVRVHTRMGARIGPAIPGSLHIAGAVSDWESWTKMRFPETGEYVFPDGLATVRIDREKDTGEYWEPNLWIIHQVRPA